MNLLKSLKKRLFPAPKIAPKLCTYDQQLVAVMRRVLRPDSSCIDVGSHVGDVLREMIAVAPRGKHHAFEALPHLATKLKARFSAVVHTSAVAEKSGTSEFQHVENDPGYSGLRQRIYDRPDPQITTILVPVTTIDETIPTNLKITLLKLDIEGGEYDVLPDLLRHGPRPTQLLLEFHHGAHGVPFAATRAAIGQLRAERYRILHVSRRGLEFSFIKN